MARIDYHAIMRRRLFTAISAVSLFLCMTTAALWVWSCYHAERWEVGYWKERPLPPQFRSSIPMVVVNVMEILHYRGQWLVQYTPDFVRRPSRPHWRQERLTESPFDTEGGIETGTWGRGQIH